MKIISRLLPFIGFFVYLFSYHYNVKAQTCDFNGTLTSCTYSVSSDFTIANLDLSAGGGTIIIDLEDTYTLTVSSGFTIPENTTVVINGNLYFNGSVANNGNLYIYGDLSGFGSIVNNPTGTMKILNDINISGSGSKLGGVVKAGGDIGASFVYTAPDDELYTFVPGDDDDFIDYFPIYLPVELLSFEGKKEEDKVNLKWVTATEINSSYFEIQHSFDLKQWKNIGHQDAGGNSNVLKTYYWSDVNNDGGYYRLKQVDLDSSFTYYGPIKVFNRNDNFKIQIYPNLVKSYDKIYIVTSDQSYSIIDCLLFDSQGKIIINQRWDSKKSSFSTPYIQLPYSLQKGYYFLSVQVLGKIETFKILVENVKS